MAALFCLSNVVEFITFNHIKMIWKRKMAQVLN